MCVIASVKLSKMKSNTRAMANHLVTFDKEKKMKLNGENK